METLRRSRFEVKNPLEDGRAWRYFTPKGASSFTRSRIRRDCCKTFSRKDLPAMKPATIVGILLIILGIVGFALGGVTFTHQKKDVDVGPVQISHESQKTVPISPILSGVALVAGIGLVIVGSRGK
jgi:preprotein translocase subunit Sss1